MAPEAEGSNPFTHPINCIQPRQEMEKAPVAQLDRVADFESVGRRFESYRARQISFRVDHDPMWALSSAGRATDS